MITTLHRIWGVMGRHRSLLIRGILATFVEAVFMSLPVGALYLLLIGYEDVSAATVWGITAMLLVGAIGQIACRCTSPRASTPWASSRWPTSGCGSARA